MSKSKYNGVDPDSIISQYGADTVRLYMLFKSPPELELEWDINGIIGIFRWLKRIWNLNFSFINEDLNNLMMLEPKKELSVEEEKLLSFVHQTIQNVTRTTSIQLHSFNIAISELMKLSNFLTTISPSTRKTITYYQSLRTLILLLNPMAPHIASEMWEALISKGPKLENLWCGSSNFNISLVDQSFPKFDVSFFFENKKIPVVVMIQGKKRLTVDVNSNLNQNEIENEIKNLPRLQTLLNGKKIEKVIFTKDQNKKFIINYVLEK